MTLKVELITKFRAVYRRMQNVSVTFLLFDTKLKDERSSIADNDTGSPLIYRVLSSHRLKCLSGQALFFKSRQRKYLFHSMATEAIERGHHLRFLVLESHVSSLPSKNNRHMAKHLPRKNKTTVMLPSIGQTQSDNHGTSQLQLVA